MYVYSVRYSPISLHENCVILYSLGTYINLKNHFWEIYWFFFLSFLLSLNSLSGIPSICVFSLLSQSFSIFIFLFFHLFSLPFHFLGECALLYLQTCLPDFDSSCHILIFKDILILYLKCLCSLLFLVLVFNFNFNQWFIQQN